MAKKRALICMECNTHNESKSIGAWSWRNGGVVTGCGFDWELEGHLHISSANEQW